MEMASGRRGDIDALKTVAILGTLFIHTSADGLTEGAPGSPLWSVDLFWAVFLRCAVPVFLMCTGALFLPAQKPLTIPRLWSKYILRIAAALAFWSLAYAVWNHVFLLPPAEGRAAGLKPALTDWLCFRHKYHLYYLVVLLAVYALLPLLRLLFQQGSAPLLKYAMVLWLVCGSLLPVLFALPPLRSAEGYVRQYALPFVLSAPGYALAGGLIAGHGRRLRPRFWGLLYLAGTALLFAGTLFVSLRGGQLSVFLSGTSPGVTLQAVGLFGLGVALWSERRPPRWTETVSRASFCIYLVHPFFLDLMLRAGFSSAVFPAWAVPVQVILLFFLGMACWAVLRRVPAVNKYLI